MFEEKIIDNKVVRRSKRYPNYGITIDAIPYRWSTNRKMKINLIGGYKQDKYFGFRICHNNIANSAYLHVVVAECWIPNDDPVNKTQVNHKDGNKRNPNIDNLEWITPAKNLQHSSITLGNRGEQLYNADLSEDQVHQVCQLLCEGFLPKDLAERFDTSKDIIRKIRAGDTYFHIRVLYNIEHIYKNDFSENTVRWVCERINEGFSDPNIAKMSTNANITTIEVKRIRYKIRYKTISDEYFGAPFND